MNRAPERIVHLGVGAFFRAHQAWYTSAVDSAKEWGIVGYTGRSATVADELQPQDCKYNLVIRGEAEDRIELVYEEGRFVPTVQPWEPPAQGHFGERDQ